jgi:hypothetical protein
MSELGQSRRFGDVRVTSAFPLIADVRQRGRQVRKVPKSDIDARYSTTWSRKSWKRNSTHQKIFGPGSLTDWLRRGHGFLHAADFDRRALLILSIADAI